MGYSIEYTREKIKSLIEDAGITQKDLAESINIEPSTLSKWLHSTEISVEGLVNIAEYFQVSVDDLIYKYGTEGQKKDVTFSGIVKFLGELAKEYGLEIECKEEKKEEKEMGVLNTYDGMQEFIHTIVTNTSMIKFSYTLYDGSLKYSCERQELAYKYIADFLKEFSNVVKIQADKKTVYNNMIDLWVRSNLDDAEEKYHEYEGHDLRKYEDDDLPFR